MPGSALKITRWRAKGLWMDVLELLGVVPH